MAVRGGRPHLRASPPCAIAPRKIRSQDQCAHPGHLSDGRRAPRGGGRARPDPRRLRAGHLHLRHRGRLRGRRGGAAAGARLRGARAPALRRWPRSATSRSPNRRTIGASRASTWWTRSTSRCGGCAPTTSTSCSATASTRRRRSRRRSSTMDLLTRQGKVLHWGVSRWTAAQLRDGVDGLPAPARLRPLELPESLSPALPRGGDRGHAGGLRGARDWASWPMRRWPRGSSPASTPTGFPPAAAPTADDARGCISSGPASSGARRPWSTWPARRGLTPGPARPGLGPARGWSDGGRGGSHVARPARGERPRLRGATRARACSRGSRPRSAPDAQPPMAQHHEARTPNHDAPLVADR